MIPRMENVQNREIGRQKAPPWPPGAGRGLGGGLVLAKEYSFPLGMTSAL